MSCFQGGWRKAAEVCSNKDKNAKEDKMTKTLETFGEVTSKAATHFEDFGKTLSKVKDATVKTANKASFQEIRMMTGQQGYPIKSCIRQVYNAFAEWDPKRSETYMVGIVHAEFLKYANSTGARIQPHEDNWR